MNADRKTNGFRKFFTATAILTFAAFLATAEAQTQGPPDADATADGVKASEEAPAFPCMDEEFFKSLDANGDGVLSRDELPARPRFGRRGKGRKGSGWLDADGDGTVTHEEASAPRMDEERFKSLDANGNGILSQDELPARPHFGRHGKGRKGAGWMDKSGDDTGSVDKAFVPPCMDEDYFKRLDANNDGVLSQDELPARPRFGRRGMGR